MNPKAILIGVNVAASLPLLITQQAQAANGQDTASFLKSVVAEKATAHSLGEQPALVARSLPAGSYTAHNVSSLSSPRAVAARAAMTPVAGTVKLRPFVPGRKLLSRAQIESRLAAQVPQLDSAPASSSALSGNVSEASFIPQADGNYSSPGYSAYTTQQIQRSQTRNLMQKAAQAYTGFERRRTPRTTPGQMPATPGQVGIPCAPQPVADMRATRSSDGPSVDDWAQMARQAAPTAADLQNLADDPEMANLAQEFMATHPAGAASTAGPAPFPLSLLPEKSLKQFIGGSAKPGAAPHGRQASGCAPSYFGSWHAGSPVASAAARTSAPPGLAPAGFHTYLTGHAAGGGKMVTSGAFKSYLPMAYTRKRSAPVPVHPQAVKPQAAPTATVLSYGEYHAAPL